MSNSETNTNVEGQTGKTAKQYEPLTKDEVSKRLQEAIDMLKVARKETTDENIIRYHGYLMRGLIEAKRLLQEAGQ